MQLKVGNAGWMCQALGRTCDATEDGLPLAILLVKQQHSSLNQLQSVPDLQMGLATQIWQNVVPTVQLAGTQGQ